MVDPKFGTKRVCESCGEKFYDLNNNPVVCPHCGHSFDPTSSVAPPAPVVAVVPAPEAPKEDADATPKNENEVSLDEIVEEDSEDEDDDLDEFDDGGVLVDDEEDDELLDDESNEDGFVGETDED